MAVRQGEDHYRTLVQLAPDVIYGLAPDGTFTVLSPAFEEITGWKVADWIGKPFAGLIHPDDLPSAVEQFEANLRGNTPPQYELRILARSGEYLVAEVRGIPRTENGKVVGSIGVARDVTDRWHAQKALQESRDQLAVILRAVDDGLTVQRPDGEIVYANDAAARLIGYDSVEEFLASSVRDVMRRFEVIDESGRPIPTDQLPNRRVLLGERLPETLVRFRIRDTGEEHWALLKVTPVLDDRGQVRFAVSMFKDVTERRRAEDARSELLERERDARTEAEIAQRRLEFLARASEILAGSLDYETTLTNLARLAVPELGDWCTIDVLEEDGSMRRIALTHPDPQKLAFIQALADRYPADPDSGIRAVLRTGQSRLVPDISKEMLVAAAHDPEHLKIMLGLSPTSAMLVPLTARDHTLGVITLLSAESRRRYGQQDLELLEDLGRRAAVAVDNARLYQQTQDALRLREEFLSIASHELKTPLTSLQLQVQMLDRLVRGGSLVTFSPERAAGILDGANRQIKRLSRLMSDLLDVARIAAGKLELDLTMVDLGILTNEVVERFRNDATVAGSTLCLHCEPDVVGRWDAFRLDQVLTNVVSNATKYGRGGQIDVSVMSDGTTARFVVRDRGIGIAAEHLGRVFDRFERMTSSQSYGGLGLGLYITRQIVDALRGKILVESELGVGSTFTVELPLARDG